jgi:dienelactone hydrolase
MTGSSRNSRGLRALLTATAVGATVLGAAAGCSGKPTPAATEAAPAFGDECAGLADGAGPVTFPDGHGGKLAGAVYGKGSTGVVLSHMSDGDICGWMPYARQLAAGGYRVIVYYFHGYGTSLGAGDGDTLDGDVLAAAGYLRSLGVGTIALVGASMGAAASLVAATELKPAPAVVVSLSAPQAYQGALAIDAVKGLTVPVLFAAGVADVEFADDAKALYDATPASTDRTLLIASSSAHGSALVGGPGSEVRDALDNALRQRAPAST